MTDKDKDNNEFIGITVFLFILAFFISQALRYIKRTSEWVNTLEGTLVFNLSVFLNVLLYIFVIYLIVHYIKNK